MMTARLFDSMNMVGKQAATVVDALTVCTKIAADGMDNRANIRYVHSVSDVAISILI